MGRSAKVIVAVALAAAVGFLAYLQIKDWHKKNIEEVVVREKVTYQKEKEKLEQKIAELQRELSVAEGKSASQEKLADAFGTEGVKIHYRSSREDQKIEDIEKQMAAFFAYIDGKKYLEAKNLKGGAYRQFQTVVEILTENPPIITGETDNIFRVLKNLAHFYSTLGKDRVNLTRDILKNEEEILENAMRVFYLWSIMDRTDLKKFKNRPSDEMLYLYSSYFLHTIGGRGYILRRDSKIRTLSYHYCVLLLDRANTEKLNSSGIDIRPHIDMSLNNIKNQMGLAYRQAYLAELDNLKRKYKM